MYKISVPIHLPTVEHCGGKEKLLCELKRIGAERVFLGLGPRNTDEVEQAKELILIKEYCEFFKKHGLEVGAWMWTFWASGENNFTKMTASNGNALNDFACPLDPEYKKFMHKHIKNIAKCGVDIIMYDDDYRYGFFTGDGILCTCDIHMKKIRDILGEDISREEFQQKAISGEKNKYRDAWLKVNGDSLKDFARFSRECLDEVNPQIRFAVCSCMSLWDNDGVDSATIARILAGSTKPLLRLIGAPYWAVNKGWDNRLQHIIELERMERSWCGDGIEIMSEGDVWPRPRYTCPSSYLEIFDMALRADGTTDGIIKYAIDYFSTTDYERGYIDKHIKNMPIYEAIDSSFGDKTASGIRIYESMNKLADMKIPEEVENSYKIENIFFSPAARMMTDCSIPTTYEGDGICGVAFGENIKYVPESAFKNGLIIDFRAAEILLEKGIDTGILKVGNKIDAEREYFCNTNEYVNIHRTGATPPGTAYKVTVSNNAKILSTFVINKSNYSLREKEVPAAYLYENDKGYRFLVFTFNMYFNSEYLFRSYARSKQISESVVWLSGGKRLPAYSYKNPDLYILTKKNENAMAVGLWNIFADSIDNPVVELDGEYKKIKFINCTGELKGNKVFLSEMPPYSFAGFEVFN